MFSSRRPGVSLFVAPWTTKAASFHSVVHFKILAAVRDHLFVIGYASGKAFAFVLGFHFTPANHLRTIAISRFNSSFSAFNAVISRSCAVCNGTSR